MEVQNAQDLEQELRWFRQVLDTRFKLYFGQESEHADIREIEPPNMSASDSNWAQLLQKHHIKVPERLALLLALVPHIEPRLLDIFFTPNSQYDRPFSEFGGKNNSTHSGFLPTGETLMFLLATNNLEQRFAAMKLFQSDHFFIKEDILSLDKTSSDDLPMTGVLSLSSDYLAYLTHGQVNQPIFGKDFPAELIRTPLEWSDLVLPNSTIRQIREIETWIEHGKTLLNDWGMKDKIRSGFRALFYGEPGTGKTLTASLIGKSTNREVYRVDLSMIVSKYIGETEKNLAKIFQQAENKGWILFFDEGDALFGKRFANNSENDSYANQEVAYLLQRIESFEGVMILASNSKPNLDEAFARRFETIIEFPVPNAESRQRIWMQGFSSKAQLGKEIDLNNIARRFELSGGAIMNVIRFASLEALKNNSNEISLRSIQQGIRRELIKEGKVL